MRRCRFCDSALEIANDGGLVDTFDCPVCGARESYGIERLPDPDQLRDRSAELEQLADEIETSELARRFEVSA